MGQRSGSSKIAGRQETWKFCRINTHTTFSSKSPSRTEAESWVEKFVASVMTSFYYDERHYEAEIRAVGIAGGWLKGKLVWWRKRNDDRMMKIPTIHSELHLRRLGLWFYTKGLALESSHRIMVLHRGQHCWSLEKTKSHLMGETLLVILIQQ
jgi:hypothetical protein